MFAALSLAAILVASPTADKWSIKPDLSQKSKATWSVDVEAQQDGQSHHARFTLVRTLSALVEGKPISGSIEWTSFDVDGQSPDDMKWPIELDARGGISSASSDDVGIITLSVFSFVYPAEDVQTGDKWTWDVKPAKGQESQAVTYSYEVKGAEKFKDKDVLKIGWKLTEKAKDGMTADGTSWVAKDGHIMKFEVDVKNWRVSVAGNGPLEAKIKGEAK